MEVDVIGTQPFFTNWTRTSTLGHQMTVRDFINDRWDVEIATTSEYELTAIVVDRNQHEIPDSILDPNDSPSFRYETIAEWLRHNWPRYYNMDIVTTVVLDWLEGTTTRGLGMFGSAGRDDPMSWWKRVAWVNCALDNSSGVLPFYAATRSEGTALHEAGHNFDADHDDGQIESNGDSTIMVPGGDDPYNFCFKGDDREVRLEHVSLCARGVIRDHTDEHVN